MCGLYRMSMLQLFGLCSSRAGALPLAVWGVDTARSRQWRALFFSSVLIIMRVCMSWESPSKRAKGKYVNSPGISDGMSMAMCHAHGSG